ncbi:unnamed protein product [Ambrosiozyma monospora]|uniref:Unnamed protein product n=1 Tax=Ambrosiozyma monospora TaxID=43982 RepID=A0A9W7DHX4_AMBMO|nr:unnamed protein product [Ambrosiozyma monospora]
MKLSTSATIWSLLLITETLSYPTDLFSQSEPSISSKLASENSKGYVKFPAQKRQINELSSDQESTFGSSKSNIKLARCDGDDDPDGYAGTYMRHDDSMYTVNFTIGSQNQPITVQVDTGSADFWIVDTNNSWCAETSQGKGVYNLKPGDDAKSHNCSIYGTFQPGDSETWVSHPEIFQVTYATNSASGRWGQDTVTLENGVVIEKVDFGLSDKTNMRHGMLGLGYITNDLYDNLPIIMKKQGLIHKNTYSLYLNEDYTTNRAAMLLFGGIDHSKYAGDLGLFPIASNHTGLDVFLNGISFSDGSLVTTIASGSARVLFDTGNGYTSMPKDILQPILDRIGAKTQPNGTFTAECSSLDGLDLTFDFMGFDLTIPVSGFVVLRYGESCKLGFTSTGESNSFSFGDSFLKNVYFVADLDDDEIALGLLDADATCEEDLEAIVGHVPSATPAPSYSAVYHAPYSLTLASGL